MWVLRFLPASAIFEWDNWTAVSSSKLLTLGMSLTRLSHFEQDQPLSSFAKKVVVICPTNVKLLK